MTAAAFYLQRRFITTQVVIEMPAPGKWTFIYIYVCLSSVFLSFYDFSVDL